MIIFRPDNHEYLIGKIKIPSVTQILQNEGLIDTYFFEPEHARKGRELHEITELVDKGLTSIDGLPADYIPYIEAYISFLRISGVKILQSEKRLYHELLGFAGTLDRYVSINGHEAIIDIKTGVKAKWHPVQLAGYKILADTNNAKMYCLYLEKTGKFKLVEYKDDIKYKNIFMSALNIYKFKHS